MYLAGTQRRSDYMDRALVECAASSFHFEQAGHLRYCARSENNLGLLFLTLGRYAEAHEHLDRAHRLFADLKDEGSVAQVKETRARVYLAEGRHTDAERSARASAKILAEGSEQALLAEALTTHGVALARLGRYAEARSVLDGAIEVAEGVGDLEGGGRAALTVVEDLAEHSGVDELLRVYGRADQLLADTEHRETNTRLRSCARLVLSKVSQSLKGAAVAPRPAAKEGTLEGENHCSLLEAVRLYEAELIRRALEANRGSITAAAQQLGVTHQTLSAIIRRRHRDFLNARKPRKRRRVSIIRRDSNHT
jgi:tetratricopeptide (TPR) repeat protein